MEVFQERAIAAADVGYRSVFLDAGDHLAERLEQPFVRILKPVLFIVFRTIVLGSLNRLRVAKAMVTSLAPVERRIPAELGELAGCSTNGAGQRVVSHACSSSRDHPDKSVSR